MILRMTKHFNTNQMKYRFELAVLLLLLATTGFAQESKPITQVPAKGTLQQSTASGKSSTGDVAKGEATTVTEGKKGLNAVNVKRSKQSEVRANAKTAVAPETDSATGVAETKHAINTKGTGATRDK
jgi:hypothetical protein